MCCGSTRTSSRIDALIIKKTLALCFARASSGSSPTLHPVLGIAIFAPSLACALTADADAAAYRGFADRLEDGLKRRLASQPAALHSFVQTIVLAKQGRS
jgi:hypothetical protein